MGDIKKAMDRMVYWCRDANLGYGQDTRTHVWPGGAADCSSLVIHVLKEAGFDTGSAYSTGDMLQPLLARGWRSVSISQRTPGCVLLSPNDHVALLLHDGNTVGEAYINEIGRITGGRDGDQTGSETRLAHYGYRNWQYCLQPPAGSTGGGGGTIPAGTTTEEEELMSAADTIINELVRSWLKPTYQKLDVMDKYCNEMFYKWVQPLWNKSVEINKRVTYLETLAKDLGTYDGPIMKHVQFYMTHLVNKGYTIEGQWYPGLHQVVAENQRRINALSAKLDSIDASMKNQGRHAQEPGVAVPGDAPATPEEGM